MNVRLYDQDIRDPLFDYLEERFAKIRVFEEKMIGRSRADMVMLTVDSIVGIEIKSDADSYVRLGRQVGFYDKYCDFNYVAVGKSHEKHVAGHVPEFWGIFVVAEEAGRIQVREKRPAAANPHMKAERQLELLWRPELQRILKRNHLPRYKEKSKRFVQQKLMEKLAWDHLKFDMCEELFERDYTRWDEEMAAYKRSGYPSN